MEWFQAIFQTLPTSLEATITYTYIFYLIIGAFFWQETFRAETRIFIPFHILGGSKNTNKTIKSNFTGDIGQLMILVLKFLKLTYLIIGLNFRYFYWIMIGWFQTRSVKKILPTIQIYIWGNVIYYHWRCT